MNESIEQQFFYPHPVAKVWDYITKAELISQWLMPNDFKLQQGHDFTFVTNPIPQLDFDGICYCKVLEIVPFKKLSYSWKGGSGNGIMSLDTVVVWTLVEKDNGTELQLNHTGFTNENVAFHTGMTAGWLKNMQKIADQINAALHGTTSV